MESEKIQEKAGLLFTRFLDDATGQYLHLYRRRGWVFSFFAVLFLAVPVYLFLKGISASPAMTVLDLFLCLLLAILWGGLPALFVFYNSRERIVLRVLAWFWTALAVAACIFWGMVLPR